MNNVILSENFSKEGWLDYFDYRSNYFRQIDEAIKRYNDETFTEVIKLGILELPDGNRVVIYFIKIEHIIMERSLRKLQYNKAVDILKDETGQAGLFIFYDQYNSFRYSLVYPIFLGVKKEYSNYKRFSYYIKAGIPHHTYEQQIGVANYDSLSEIKDVFSVDKVTKEFYIQISLKFLELVGGERTVGKKRYNYRGLLKLPENNAEFNRQFSVRLLGRLIFCWFLKMKKSANNLPLIPEELISSNAVSKCKVENYYHTIIEPLFFETLNKRKDEREEQRQNGVWSSIPFLNGGLFEADKIDYYDPNNKQLLNTLKIPNDWFIGLFKLFEQYNFTVDESTSIDIEIAVDPEMLGRIFENLLAELVKDTGETARKKTGSYYTPRFVVEYIVNNSLYNYLSTHLNISRDKILTLVFDIDEAYPFTETEKLEILRLLSNLKIIDPACGSGAFLMGAMQKMLEIISFLDPASEFWKQKIINSVTDPSFKNYLIDKLKNENINYIIKLGLIRDNIYGIDILTMATEISKLRFFLSLIVDENIDDDKENRGILALPNLEFKFIAADSVLDLKSNLEDDLILKPYIEELKTIMNNYFTSMGKEKELFKQEFIQKQIDISTILSESGKLHPDIVSLLNWNPFKNETVDWFNADWMFGLSEGFDIIIGNPPYVCNKSTDKGKVPKYKEKYGISDDLYNYFFLRALELTKPEGIISFITSNTYLTIHSKHNLRIKFLENKIIELIKVDNPFENPLVDPAIISIQKKEKDQGNYEFEYKNAKSKNDTETDFYNPEIYNPNTKIYRNTAFNALFPPNAFNMKIWNIYEPIICRLVIKYWNLIITSRHISKNENYLSEYRKNLKPGDITLLGLITEGGQGMATADNGRFVAVLEGTKESVKIKQSRANQLYKAVINNGVNELNIKSLQEAKEYLADLSEKEIWDLFDDLKNKYDRDIFGRGYLYKIINKSERANVENLTPEERKYGIDNDKPHWVPYDKGDKEGNRWYLKTSFYLDWSIFSLVYYKTQPSCRWQGYNFFFRNGFCWSDIKTVYLKCRLKEKSVYDVTSMSLFSLMPDIPDWFFVCLINSKFISEYVNDFVNNTSVFQINDARQLPIIIPNQEELDIFQKIFNSAYKIQLQKFNNEISKNKAEEKLTEIQNELDSYVYTYYGL